MTNVLLSAAGASTEAPSDVGGVVNQVTEAAGGIFSLASQAFTFMLSNPLCFLMIGAGFCFTAMGLARKALRVAKRG